MAELQAALAVRQQHHQQLQDTAHELNLQITDVPGDGSCGFHAALTAARFPQNPQLQEGYQLRQQVVDWLEPRLAPGGELHAHEQLSQPAASARCADMRDNAYHADSYMLLGIAAVLGRQVVVHSTGEQPLRFPETVTANLPPFHLGHLAELGTVGSTCYVAGHFLVMIPAEGNSNNANISETLSNYQSQQQGPQERPEGEEG